MNRLIHLAFFLVLVFSFSLTSMAQVFWTETFDGTACAAGSGCDPSLVGWTQTVEGPEQANPNRWYVSDREDGNAPPMCGSAGSGDQSLHIGNISTSPAAFLFCPTGDCGAAYDGSNGTASNKLAASPVIDCSAQIGTITVDFNYIENGEGNDDNMTFWYRDGIATAWTQIDNITKSPLCGGGQGQWTAYSITLPATSSGNADVQIGFHWICDGDNTAADPSCAVDDITLTLTTTGCDATITAAGPFCESDAAVNLTAAQAGGTWSGTGITDAVNGTFDPSVAGPGTHTITYTLSCGDSDTEDITVNADGDATFSYGATSYCLSDPDPTPTVSGTPGGTFTIDNSGTINSATGEIDLSASGTGSFVVTYTTPAPCSDSQTFNLTITSAANATITATSAVCENDAAFNLSAADPGGTWSGTGITDAVNGTFDPSVAGAGTHTITYTISGSCGDTDTEDVVVNAADDASFSYASASYCLSDPDPTPTVTGTGGGTFSIDNGGTINPTTGEIDISASGANSYVVTYTTGGVCPDTQTFNVTLTTGADATITPAGPFCESDAAVTLSAADPGGTWSGTGITNASTGEFDPATAGAGTHTITYSISGTCGDTDTEDITVNADQDATFSYSSGSYCLSDPNPFPTISGTSGGTFSIDNAGVIDAVTGEIDIASSGANTYVVTYTTPGPCADVQTFNVTLTAGADATISATTAVCENDPAFNLSAADPGGTWSGTGITDAVNGTFDPSVAGAGTHTVTYTIGGSCGDTDTETVTVNAQDDASFNYASSTYCLSDPDPFATVTGTGGGTFTIDAGGTINASNGQIDLSATGAGSFTVTYTTSGACPNSQTFAITISAAFDATITAAGPFCDNDPAVTLSAADPGGTWSGTGITNASTGEFDPATAGAGTHTITYTISGSCGDTDTETITVTASDDATFSYSASSFCDSDPNPTATVTGTPGGTFTIDAGGTIDPTSGEIDLAASGAGSYTVTYTTSGSCPASSTFSVTITTCVSPTADFSISDDLICEGDCITFTDLSTGNPTSWLWTFPGGTPASSSSDDPGLVCFNVAGTHDVELIVTNAFGADTIIMPVTVTPTPVVNAGPDENIIIGESVVLTATGTGGTYTWTDATTLSCGVCQSTTASPQVTTGYLVTLVDSAGCIATDSVVVNVTYVEEVGVPNAFSPNGDGVNDVLYVNGAGFSEIDFKVYNRYGQLVFHTVDPSIGWDGTGLDGKTLNPGTFAYVLDFSFIGAAGGIKSGNISLIK